MKGGGAQASFVDVGTSIHITIGETDSGQTHAAFLIFDYTVADPTSYLCNGSCYYTRYVTDYGWGDISANDAQFSPNAAHVHTTTGPTFNTLHCVSDIDHGSTCEPGTGGTADVTWQNNGMESRFDSGVTRLTTSAYTMESHGANWSVSAGATGTLLGHALPPLFGDIQDTHQSNVDKSVVPNSP